MTEHRLFVDEDRLAVELVELHAKYLRRQEVDAMRFYSDKLGALKTTLAQLNGVVSDGNVASIRRAELVEEIRATVLLRAHEDEEELAVVRRMATIWAQVRRCVKLVKTCQP